MEAEYDFSQGKRGAIALLVLDLMYQSFGNGECFERGKEGCDRVLDI